MADWLCETLDNCGIIKFDEVDPEEFMKSVVAVVLSRTARRVSSRR